jgi:1-acyl-sn-glycerol-3-phosphate acyltransferase
MTYRFIQFFLRLIFRLISHIEIQGMENVPKSGAYIAVANHIGRLDAVLVYFALNRNDIIMMVAEKYKKNAFFRWLVRVVDGIYIDRFNADLSAMREIMRRLKAGGVLVMAPEGTRSPTATLQEGKAGASYMAAKSGLPILPVCVTGTEDELVVERLRHFKKLNIVIHAGKTFTLPQLSLKDREKQLPLFTEEIMCQIAALLPECYRGVYADHPRTADLLSQAEAFKQAELPELAVQSQQ